MSPKHDPLRDEMLDQPVAYYEYKEISEVPKLPAGKLCNARRTRDGEFVGYCNKSSGWGTDDDGGRCKLHGGASPGAPEGNQNATTHGLTADPTKYHESLPPEEREFVLDVAASIEDRIRDLKGDVDYVDRVLARRVAIKLHIVANATDYVRSNGLTETVFTEDGSFDKESPLLPVLRQYDREIWNELRDLGLLDDPESKKAGALSEWRSYISEAER